VEKRVVRVLATEVEDAVVLVVIVLSVTSPEQIHAKRDLMLPKQNIDVIGELVTGDGEAAQGACAAPDIEAAIVDCELEEVLRRLVHILHAQFGGVNPVGARTPVIGSSSDCEMERVH